MKSRFCQSFAHCHHHASVKLGMPTTSCHRCDEYSRPKVPEVVVFSMAEYFDPTGRECIEWKLRPGRDNHLLDCMAMASVAASVQGVTLGANLQATSRKRTRRVITKAQLPKRW